MAKRGRTSPRQRAAREAARRAAAAVRLAAAGPPRPRRHEQRHEQRHDVVAELAELAELVTVPAPARAADDHTGGTPSPAPACAAGCRVCAE
ncbi:hypothetical protein, partial [Streptomyces sp. SID10815]|uniref:hypothetical protein n=1 Tax=Streptomyces sp. SID10815 TaxID=2706027 RepID=UPI0019430C57